MKLFLSICCFLACIIQTNTHAQESVNASGGEAIGSGGSVSFTVGETMFISLENSSGSEAQGVQHAYEIFVVGLAPVNMDISLNVYPNPTTDELVLSVSHLEHNLVFSIYDIQGKLLQTGLISENITNINISAYQSATYFIHVVNSSNLPIQSFKIIKQ